MRGQNIQHGQKRRMPWAIKTPIIALCILIPILLAELFVFFGPAW